MNGEIDFSGALTERVGLLKGLPAAKLDEAASRIRYMPGGATLVATMKKHGAQCALVSGGFTHFTALVKKTLGFDSDAANVLKHDGRTLSGCFPNGGRRVAAHAKQSPQAQSAESMKVGLSTSPRRIAPAGPDSRTRCGFLFFVRPPGRSMTRTSP